MPRCTEEQRNLTRLGADDETWKDIPGYVGIYQISNKGRVKHLPTAIIEVTSKGEVINTRSTSEYILKASERKQDSYYCVGLVRDGKISVTKVHRLVAQAFCPRLPEQTEVHHIDHDRHNNTDDNLVWLTLDEHADKHRMRCRMQCRV